MPCAIPIWPDAQRRLPGPPGARAGRRIAHRRGAPAPFALRMGLSGLAVAAAVATVAWVAQPYLSGGSPGGEPRAGRRQRGRRHRRREPARLSRSTSADGRPQRRAPGVLRCRGGPLMALVLPTRWPALGRAATWPAHRAAWFAATLFAAFLAAHEPARAADATPAAAPRIWCSCCRASSRRPASRTTRAFSCTSRARPSSPPVWSMCWTAPASASAWKSWTASRANICAITKMCSA